MQEKNGDVASPALVSATPVPPLATTTALPQGDSLRADIAALQQQALATQSAIRELQQREAQLNTSWWPDLPGLSSVPSVPVPTIPAVHLPEVQIPEVPPIDTRYADTALLWPAFALALLLVWIRTRRASPAPEVPASPAFVEKRTAPRRPEDDPHFVDRDLDFQASDHHSDWGQDAMDDMDGNPDGDSRFWEPEMPRPAAAFDSETAAVEVHRVRESLAHKRAARAMGHGSGHVPLSAEHSGDGSPPIDRLGPDEVTASYPRTPQVDIELDISIEPPPASPVVDVPPPPADPAPPDVLQLGGDLDMDLGLGTSSHVPVQAEPSSDDPSDDEDTIPPSYNGQEGDEPLPELAVDANGESPCEIKLALALEFLELGLLPGAREIAMELLESPQAHVREKAAKLIVDIQVQEGVNNLPLFESSAFVDPSSLLLSSSDQMLISDPPDSQQ